MQGFYIP